MKNICHSISLILFSSIFCMNGFAAPGIKITYPQEGATIHSGQDLTINIEPIDGFVAVDGYLTVGDTKTAVQFTNLPTSISVKMPQNILGEINIVAFANDAAGNSPLNTIKVVVAPPVGSNLVSFDFDMYKSFHFEADWNGNILTGPYAHVKDYLRVWGVYSDGNTRRMPKSDLSYISSDSSVVSVDNQGNIAAHKGGNAIITVSSGNVTGNVQVFVESPSGIKPSQTTPPTINIDIEPKPNAAGWWNSNITISLTAQAAAQSAGIRDIFYEFPYINADSPDIANTQVVIPFSTEGVNLLRYGATDKEGNDTGQQSTTINLDKTPPDITLTLLPVNPKPKCKEDDFPAKYFGQLSYSTTDKLSGLKGSNAGLAIPDISAFKIKLKNDNQTSVIINLKRKVVTIHAPNPQDILNQLKTGIFSIANNQTLHLNVNPKRNKIRILPQGNFLALKGPTLTLKAIATDNADNIGTKDLAYPNVNPAPVTDDENGEDE